MIIRVTFVLTLICVAYANNELNIDATVPETSLVEGLIPEDRIETTNAPVTSLYDTAYDNNDIGGIARINDDESDRDAARMSGEELRDSEGNNPITGKPIYSNSRKGNGMEDTHLRYDPVMGRDFVKSPGYTTGDTKTSPGGHYYLGSGRRRIGAGFGRRRAPVEVPLSKEEQEQGKKELKDIVNGKKHNDFMSWMHKFKSNYKQDKTKNIQDEKKDIQEAEKKMSNRDTAELARYYGLAAEFKGLEDGPTFYSKANYKGTSFTPGASVKSMEESGKMLKNDMSSLKVPKGWCAELFAKNEWQGASIKFCGPVKVWSLSNETLVLNFGARETTYSGHSFRQGATRSHETTWDDQVSSVKLTKFEWITHQPHISLSSECDESATSAGVCNRHCVNSCGVAAHTYTGAITCQQSKHVEPKKTVPDSMCEKVKLTKPMVPKHRCEETPACVQFRTSPTDKGEVLAYSNKHVQYLPQNLPPHDADGGMVNGPKELCTTTCGFRGDTKLGAVWCQVRNRYSTDGKLPPEVKPKSVSPGKHTSESKCTYWGLKKPATPKKQCPATPACTEYVAAQPTEACKKKCGVAKETFTGKVFCREVRSQQEVADAKCDYWKHDKPDPISKTCPATHPCTSWVRKAPTEDCNYHCGFAGDTYYGKVFCQEVVSGKTVSNSKCSMPQHTREVHTKPAALKKTCRATPACVVWKTSAPTEKCTSTCGFAGDTKLGKSFCQDAKTNAVVPDAKCEFSGYGSSNLGLKPAVPKKTCPATLACVEWKSAPSAQKCPSNCGYTGGSLDGTIWCEESASGSRVADAQCVKRALSPKPDVPATKCEPTLACVSYLLKTPTELNMKCPTQCGHPESTLTGSVKCVVKKSSEEDDASAPAPAPAEALIAMTDPGSPFQIKSKHGKCLDASQRNRQGGKVHMWSCNTGNWNQQWVYTPSTGQIKSKHGKCLDASQRNRQGGKVQMWSCNTGNYNQQWVYTPSTGEIKAKHGKCLDASQRNRNGGLVHMWSCNTGNYNQQWDVPVPSAAPAPAPAPAPRGNDYEEVDMSACEDPTRWPSTMPEAPTAPKQQCGAAAVCVDYETFDAPACSTECGHEAETLEGKVSCHETKTGKATAMSKCEEAGLEKPDKPTRHCEENDPCPTPKPTRVPTSAPTDRPTATPTASPTPAPTSAPTILIIKNGMTQSDSGGDKCSEWGQAEEMAFRANYKVSRRAQVNGPCFTYHSDTGGWSDNHFYGSSDSKFRWNRYEFSAAEIEAMGGKIHLSASVYGFESDGSNSNWKNCKYTSGDECEEEKKCSVYVKATKGTSGAFSCGDTHKLRFDWEIEADDVDYRLYKNNKRCANYKVGGQWTREWHKPGSLQQCANLCVRMGGDKCNYFSYANGGTENGSCLFTATASGCKLEHWNNGYSVYKPLDPYKSEDGDDIEVQMHADAGDTKSISGISYKANGGTVSVTCSGGVWHINCEFTSTTKAGSRICIKNSGAYTMSYWAKNPRTGQSANQASYAITNTKCIDLKNF